MKGVFVRVVLALAVLVSVTSCESHREIKYLVAFSQANNAEPYRAAQNRLMEKLFAKYPDVHLVITEIGRASCRERV